MLVIRLGFVTYGLTLNYYLFRAESIMV